MSENTQKKARSIEMVTGSLWKNIIFSKFFNKFVNNNKRII